MRLQLVELGVVAGGDDAAVAQDRRRLLDDRAHQQRVNVGIRAGAACARSQQRRRVDDRRAGAAAPAGARVRRAVAQDRADAPIFSATRARPRSTSPTCAADRAAARAVRLSISVPIACRRSSTVRRSRSGRCSQRRNSRPPIAVAVRSSTAATVQSGRSARLVSSSRLRRVAASSSTASPRSSVRRPRRCGNEAFCVSRTYCSRQPAAATASARSAQPKPDRSRVCELLAQRARRGLQVEVPRRTLAGERGCAGGQLRLLGDEQLRRPQSLDFARAALRRPALRAR